MVENSVLQLPGLVLTQSSNSTPPVYEEDRPLETLVHYRQDRYVFDIV